MLLITQASLAGTAVHTAVSSGAELSAPGKTPGGGSSVWSVLPGSSPPVARSRMACSEQNFSPSSCAFKCNTIGVSRHEDHRETLTFFVKFLDQFRKSASCPTEVIKDTLPQQKDTTEYHDRRQDALFSQWKRGFQPGRRTSRCRRCTAGFEGRVFGCRMRE